jgi:hypothetical protein
MANQPRLARRTTLVFIALLLAVAGSLAAHAGISLPSIASGGAQWFITNSAGNNEGLPNTGGCNGSPGFAINDAALPSAAQGDAFDLGLTMWVDNSIFASPGPAGITSQTATAGPMQMSGLNVSMEYHAVTSAPVLRTVGTFNNSTSEPITTEITFATNVGSDDRTEITGSSDGDLTFTGDRWIVTDDTGVEELPSDAPGERILAPADGDPAITHVFYGPGGPVTPSAVSQVVFDCDDGNEGILVTYQVTVPAGATRRLMLFNRLDETSSNALASVGAFDAPSAAYLAGLEPVLDQIVNWAFGDSEILGRLRVIGQGSIVVNRVRAAFSATARRDARRPLTGTVLYTQSGVNFRSTRLTSVRTLGPRGVRVLGLGRVNAGPHVAFSVDLVDNGAGGDTFALSVTGGPTVPTTPLRNGNIQILRPGS